MLILIPHCKALFFPVDRQLPVSYLRQEVNKRKGKEKKTPFPVLHKLHTNLLVIDMW